MVSRFSSVSTDCAPPALTPSTPVAAGTTSFLLPSSLAAAGQPPSRPSAQDRPTAGTTSLPPAKLTHAPPLEFRPPWTTTLPPTRSSSANRGTTSFPPTSWRKLRLASSGRRGTTTHPPTHSRSAGRGGAQLPPVQAAQAPPLKLRPPWGRQPPPGAVRCAPSSLVPATGPGTIRAPPLRLPATVPRRCCSVRLRRTRPIDGRSPCGLPAHHRSCSTRALLPINLRAQARSRQKRGALTPPFLLQRGAPAPPFPGPIAVAAGDLANRALVV